MTAHRIRAVLMVFALVAIGLAPSSSRSEASKTVPARGSEISLSFAPLVKTAAPAVVNIYARRVVQSRSAGTLFDDPFFQRFFGDNFSFGVPRERVENSLGSGVIVAAEGVIVTNHHVIENANEIIAVLSDRREFAAKVVLSDDRTDLAVLRVDAGEEKLPHLDFGDSDGLEVGDLVLAIGNPFGVGQTVTSGIVSALARTQVGVSDYRFFIQTDAAINPGNSGGALIAMDGKLVGVNTAIFTRGGGSIGIGWAIPANMVRSVVNSALSNGKIVRPWFGASVQAVTADIANSLGLKRPTGVLVNEIYPSGPADKAGLRVGDVVVAVADQDVIDEEGLKYRIGTMEVGGRARLQVLRAGRATNVLLPLSAPPEVPAREETWLEGEHPFDGAKIANLSPAFAEELGLNPLSTGVIVIEITQRSYAAYRFRPGDIILSVNGAVIYTVEDLREILSAKLDGWDIKLRRNGQLMRVTVRR